jgi:hypothetical protein
MLQTSVAAELSHGYIRSYVVKRRGHKTIFIVMSVVKIMSPQTLGHTAALQLRPSQRYYSHVVCFLGLRRPEYHISSPAILSDPFHLNSCQLYHARFFVFTYILMSQGYIYYSLQGYRRHVLHIYAKKLNFDSTDLILFALFGGIGFYSH